MVIKVRQAPCHVPFHRHFPANRRSWVWELVVFVSDVYRGACSELRNYTRQSACAHPTTRPTEALPNTREARNRDAQGTSMA
ncbi:hypothetical protein BVIET440_60231 [Burkholderia vietnamiensis]